MIDFSCERFKDGEISSNDAVTLFMKERRGFKGSAKNVYAK